MTTLKEFKIRHKQTSRELAEIAKNKLNTHGVVKCTEKVSSALNISSQTVRNYLEGRGKDGFLLEAIIKEFKELEFT